MKTTTIPSWDNFLKVISHIDVGEVGKVAYTFRGQPNSSWGLKPSLLRYFDDGITAKEALEIEKLGLAEFKSTAHLHMPQNLFSKTKDTTSWWVMMQHHGAPTRTLDWTTSIYVAAYFAVHGDQETDGAIWLVHAGILQEKMGVVCPKTEEEVKKVFLSPDSPPYVFFVTRQTKTDRMAAQQGIFSVCGNVIGNQEEIFERELINTPDKLMYAKLVIPSKLKPLFVRKLRAMNITAMTLFPGIDGLGKSVAELIQLKSAP